MDTARFPTLDPELAAIVALIPDEALSLGDLPGARAGLDSLVAMAPVPDTSGLQITDRQIPGPPGAPEVTVRVYRPTAAAGLLPAIVYLHGGGFCLGTMETEHGGAVALASGVGALVVNVDYRLAPEHPYPAGLEDCYAALVWLAGAADELGVDPARIAVHGGSAGGGLSAGLALLARDRGGPALCFQSLGIPELDDRLDTPSMQAFTATPMWSRPLAEYSWRYYLGETAGTDEVPIYAAPARAVDLAGLPPAYVTTMELDPLRDEGITYAMRLLAAGVSVELHSFPGTFHGSALVTSARVTQRGSAELITVLRRALSP